MRSHTDVWCLRELVPFLLAGLALVGLASVHAQTRGGESCPDEGAALSVVGRVVDGGGILIEGVDVALEPGTDYTLVQIVAFET